MAKIGYIHVSTNDQNTDLQRDALIRAECEQIFDDKMSGTKANRPGLKRALKHLQTGDTLVVSPDEIAQINRLVKSGHTRKQLAIIYDVSLSTVYKFSPVNVDK
ncbi:recombinase family protein [Salmonella enterica]|nr:recombinase family protein [Salmonella enterica]